MSSRVANPGQCRQNAQPDESSPASAWHHSTNTMPIIMTEGWRKLSCNLISKLFDNIILQNDSMEEILILVIQFTS